MIGGLSSFVAARRVSLVIAVLGLAVGAGPTLAADSHPDFSGVWTWHRVPGGPRFARPWRKDPPFTEIAKQKIAAYHKLIDPTGETPGGYCVGTGMPGDMLGSGGYPMEVIQRPEQITIIYEAWTEIRRIYIDAKPVADKDLIPTRNGYSVGHWEGDTLVVETKSLEEQVDQAAAHSEQARVEERYSFTKDKDGKKLLTATLTMTDPVFYTAPVTVTKTWEPTDERMLNYDCTEPDWEDHLDQLRQKAEAKGDGKKE